jgi:CheY-like chemotaxis protein
LASLASVFVRRGCQSARRGERTDALRPRVLVVDDEPTVRAVVCDQLADFGCQGDEAEDGVAAVALLRRRRYDLVITDLRMPGMTGWDVVDSVRARVPTMPVILISGFPTDDDVKRAQRAGVPVLQKPFSVAEFQRAVISALAAEPSRAERPAESDVPRKPLMKVPEEPRRDPEAQADQA